LLKGGLRMKKRILVMLAAAAVAVAMFALSGSAWGQDAELGNGDTSVGASAQGDPVIKPRKPKPGSNIFDPTPTIKAKVFDRDRQLKKKHIKLFLDDNQISREDFNYKRSKDLLKFAPDRRLRLGKHTVKITAGPKNDRATRSWSFKIVCCRL
jgi:hypothetical protein